MRIVRPTTGESYVSKRRKRIDQLGNARELTFSCYKRFPFLIRDRPRTWFIEALRQAKRKFAIDLWAYVIMPDHVHLIVYPREPNVQVGRVVGTVKEYVARRAIRYLEQHAPEWLARITVQEGLCKRRRFWQPGGGFDRNVTEPATLYKMIEYIHLNPVRKNLVAKPEDWEWSSARWYAGVRPVSLEMDATVPRIYEAGRSS